MNPEPANKETEIADRIGAWVADVMRLIMTDKAAASLPAGYFLSALMLILCGRLNESVDLMCSQRLEPTMQDVIGMVRKCANIQRIELVLRNRNDMHVDEVRGKGHSYTGTLMCPGKGQGPWGYPSWNYQASQNYEPPGYAFSEHQPSSDYWGEDKKELLHLLKRGKATGNQHSHLSQVNARHVG